MQLNEKTKNMLHDFQIKKVIGVSLLTTVNLVPVFLYVMLLDSTITVQLDCRAMDGPMGFCDPYILDISASPFWGLLFIALALTYFFALKCKRLALYLNLLLLAVFTVSILSFYQGNFIYYL